MADARQADVPPAGSPLERAAVTALAVALTLGAIAWACDLYARLGLQIYNEQFIAAMLATALALAYLHLPARRGAARGRVAWYDAVAALLALAAGWYLAVQYPKLVDLILLRPPDAVALSCVLIVLTLEALRRATGNVLVIIVVVFLIYGLLGDHVPGQLQGRAQDWQRLSAYLAIDVNGMMGIPVLVASTIVVAFILFGSLLSATGGSQFFTEAALVAMGRFRGGAAKIAVFASGLFGSISGSAVANVVATGIVTIPMIKRSGYPGHKAGAIEAVASTGGQLMPPVMGAAAFLMAEFLQIPYSDVVLAALMPAILYYVALFIQADLEAARAGIARVPENEIPRVRSVLAGLHFIIPFVVLLVSLFTYNAPPETAALYAAVSVIALSLVLGYRGKRPALRPLLSTLRETGLASLDIILIGAAAGMVIGVLSVTGLGFNLTLALVQIGGDNLVLLLVLAALVCIVLGMGLPTVGVYVLLAALVAPALVKVGVNPIAAHLYVMYFGMMSMITPPVAIAAYAAAGLAQADPVRTGLAAVRFGWSAYVVPFLFVASPSLILIGDSASIAQAVFTAIIGVWVASIGVVGYLTRPLSVPMRALFFVLGVMALVPANAFEAAVYTDLAGVFGGLLLIAREYLATRGQRRRNGEPMATPARHR